MPCGCGGYRKVEKPVAQSVSPPPQIATAVPSPVSSSVVSSPNPPVPSPVAPASKQVEILAVSSTPSTPIGAHETITDLIKQKREALLALRRSQNRQY